MEHLWSILGQTVATTAAAVLVSFFFGLSAIPKRLRRLEEWSGRVNRKFRRLDQRVGNIERDVRQIAEGMARLEGPQIGKRAGRR